MSKALEKEYCDGDSRLTETELRKRLALYTDPAITDELYDFGKMMVEKAVERFKGLDTKAAAIAAYSIGIITLLASTQTAWVKALQVLAVLPIFSAIAAFVSAAYAVSALWLKKTEWFSQDEWIKADGLANAEILRRTHLIYMWGVLSSHQTASDAKASRIVLAEGALIASAALLVLTLGIAVFLGFIFGFGISLR
jgi:hypothetical protein